ncbi:SAM-dependent methyltransferase [Desulfosarcina ovata subsp. sediminis]|uniref:SAM-dependent methyltransferase n=1 Tax=Desulfosarcina ovata subsp. sediminis TaxID=885957 RepID=A0A5K7ZV65_9BACT|nr:methyltransferase domain-containing protein [Desulfosarcina ovata]BBO84127.1 SAM-dependent methyltransferase [Desulfosarcina ovata subsp. sediminis]
MTDQDRRRWDEKYRKDPGAATPAAILEKFWHLAPLGNAVDIACGNGRNSIFLAEKGFAVDAVDISTVATAKLTGRHPNIHVHCLDLDTWQMPEDCYTLVVNFRFLDRRLFPMILKGLKPGGVLIFESFIGKEKDVAFCLQPNELLHAFESLRIVYYEEKKSDAHHSDRFDQTAALVAIKIHPNVA